MCQKYPTVGLHNIHRSNCIGMTQFHAFFSIKFLWVTSYYTSIITQWRNKSYMFSPLLLSSEPCDHCDKWNNSISRGSAWRKYNAVNVIYRINHDLLCDPESARKFHRKPRARNPINTTMRSLFVFFPLFPLYFFQPYYVYTLYIHIHFIICTYTRVYVIVYVYT